MRIVVIRFLATAFMLAGCCAVSTAKDRALLIGIDRYLHAHDTEGCENDTVLLKEFLTKRLNFKGDDIHVLTNEKATVANIRDQVRKWLIEGTQPGDRVFFAYAGHGTRVPDERDGDETLDHMDEALAVYEVQPKRPVVYGSPVTAVSGYITDDEVSGWVADLNGRQVVMLFDSCHSGTISRGVGGGEVRPSRFLRFKEEADGRGTQDVYSPDYNTNPLGRDMDEATEGFLKKAVNGVVVISAARADQEAFPVYASRYGRVQGALTYLFVEKQEGMLIPVGSLQSVLNEGIEELKRTAGLNRGRNGQYQSPQVEIYSRQLAGLPIFGGLSVGSWAASLELALHNQLSQAEVKIRTADGRKAYSITKGGGLGKVGEMIPLVVSTTRPGHLYIWVFSRDDKLGDVAKCLFPSKHEENNEVGAGTISFPRCEGGKAECSDSQRYEFYATEPAGEDVWVALVTDRKLPLRGYDHVYSWSEAFEAIGLEKVRAALSKYVREATTRGGGIRPSQPTVMDWQAGSLVLQAHR
ncbi:MAG TPA: caspase family protein [Pyrinomonadaceae bacterium]